ncbi:MAG: CHAT domain-containing protein [Spirulina sp. SIO3F2]|nr:CHAT domain-containing protein [Spirulina sp. SIO3F2]
MLPLPFKRFLPLLLISFCWGIAPRSLHAEPDVNPELEALDDSRRALELYRQGTPEAWRSAIALWDESLSWWEAAGDQAQITQTLTWLGAVNYRLGNLDAAQKIYNRLLTLHRQTGDRFSEAQTLSALAELQEIQGQYQQALQTQEQALALWQTQTYRSGEALSLNHLGRLAQTLGEPEQAREYYEQTLAIVRTVENRQGEAATLNNLGQVYDRQGKTAEAIAQYQAALQLWEQLGNRRNQAAALNNLGYAQTANEPESAQANLEQALKLWQAVGDRRGEASTLSNLGVLLAQKEQYLAAQQYQEQALKLRKATGDRLKEALTYYRLAQVKRQLGKQQPALQDIRAAIAIVENLRTTIERQELRTSFFATQQDYYEFYIDLLMELDAQNPNQGYAAEALKASESAKARSLLDVLVAANADIRQGVSPQLLEREQVIQAQLDAAEKRRISLFAAQAGGTSNSSDRGLEVLAIAISQEISRLLVEYEQVQSNIRLTSPHYASLTQPQPLSVTQIQRQVLDADTVLLEYFLGRDRSYLWVVTSKGITSYRLPGREEITRQTRRTYRQLGRAMPPERLLSRLTTMSETLLAPAAQQLQGKRLLIVADGILNYLPFAALQDPEQLDALDYTPLIADHEIVMLPSASTLGILRREHRDRPPAPEQLAILADPVFGLDDDRVTTKTGSKLEIPTALARAAAEANVVLSRLPFTREEAETIAALFDPKETITALGTQANRNFVTNPDLNQYQIVHFATHGLLNSATPELSGLALSLVDRQGEPQNGFLRFHEIFNLDLNAELVVLSACQTGIGPVVRGEGAISLTRGFMYAGAERVLVSLWNVDDEGTARLMETVYQEMLDKGLTPAAALRAAQQKLASSEQWRSPYYWAAFTLQGEWQ